MDAQKWLLGSLVCSLVYIAVHYSVLIHTKLATFKLPNSCINVFLAPNFGTFSMQHSVWAPAASSNLMVVEVIRAEHFLASDKCFDKYCLMKLL